MPSVVVKLYSVFFKLLLKHKLNSSQSAGKDEYRNSPRSSVKGIPANASFVDGVASKDINIDSFTSLSLRIFLPQSALPQDQITHPGRTGLFGYMTRDSPNGFTAEQSAEGSRDQGEGTVTERGQTGRHPYDDTEARISSYGEEPRNSGIGGGAARLSSGGERRSENSSEAYQRELKQRLRDGYARLDESSSLVVVADNQLLDESSVENKAELEHPARDMAMQTHSKDQKTNGDRKGEAVFYQGYQPVASVQTHKKLPIIIQFHGGGFVSGSKDSVANDLFCRRMAKLCDAIVVAVGYRLAPEHKYPAAFEDGFEALCWLARQSNLAECTKSLGYVPSGFLRSGSDAYRPDLHRELVDSFGCSVVEPWLAAHGDTSRCVLLGVSSGGNIVDHVARKAVLAGKLLEPVKVVAQVLMYPFFIGSIPTPSEIKLGNSYFYDKATCLLAWRLFLPDDEYDLDHPAANPLIAGREPPLKLMPPTLTIVAELDLMKDRAIGYSEALRKVNIDAPVLEYKDTVHEFATLDFLINSREAKACTEDMAIWIKKYISLKGHELSY